LSDGLSLPRQLLPRSNDGAAWVQDRRCPRENSTNLAVPVVEPAENSDRTTDNLINIGCCFTLPVDVFVYLISVTVFQSVSLRHQCGSLARFDRRRSRPVRFRYVRSLHSGEQYVASTRFGWKIVSQPSQVSHGRRGRRFFKAIPLRITASHSEEQVSSFGVRLFMMATIGRPQCTHVMATAISKPFG
jgi:hypothetical protein